MMQRPEARWRDAQALADALRACEPQVPARPGPALPITKAATAVVPVIIPWPCARIALLVCRKADISSARSASDWLVELERAASASSWMTHAGRYAAARSASPREPWPSNTANRSASRRPQSWPQTTLRSSIDGRSPCRCGVERDRGAFRPHHVGHGAHGP